MEEPTSSLRVIDNSDKKRYEAYVGDQLAGFVAYRTRPGVVILVHTEVDEAFEGHGVGGHLAAEALADIQARGLKVAPICPFIVEYLERHPELSDLVVSVS
jgi:predicted GNAT family acetyltransferase